jgi:hypothetical protein
MAEENNPSIPVSRIILFLFPNDDLHRSSHEGPRSRAGYDAGITK